MFPSILGGGIPHLCFSLEFLLSLKVFLTEVEGLKTDGVTTVQTVVLDFGPDIFLWKNYHQCPPILPPQQHRLHNGCYTFSFAATIASSCSQSFVTFKQCTLASTENGFYLPFELLASVSLGIFPERL